jgi:hypothetical protein
MRRCLALCLVPLAACADAVPRAAAPTVRDSAGIRIVENTGPAWQPGQEWSLSAEPVLDIGSGDSEEDQLFGVRAAYRLGDGRIVIANGGTNEIRFYAADGAFLSASGRSGQGPGEFERLQGLLRLPGDSLVARDHFYKPQLSVFDPMGNFVRTVSLDALLAVIGVFDDGSMLAQGSPRMEGDLAGFQRYDSPLYHVPPEGQPTTHSGDFPGSEIYQVVSGNSVSVYEPFFARTTQYFAGGNSIYIAENDSYEYRLHDPDGGLRTIVRRDFTPLPVTGDDVAQFREAILDRARDTNLRRRWEGIYRDIPVPGSMPAYTEIHLDDLLNVWVLEYERPGSDEVRWTVFDSTGTMLGEVEGRTGVTPYHIGPSHMVGLWRDELDVEHVRVYEIEKPGQ